jgi:transcriptional regulator with PAS, ATPase and Fis domain
MKAIVYWDIDSLRIRKVLRELEPGFDVRLASTLSEFQMIASGRAICARVIGTPRADQESIGELLSKLSSNQESPIFVLVGKHIPAGFDTTMKGFFISSDEIPSLRSRIIAAAGNVNPGEKGTGRIFIGKSKVMEKVSCLVRKYAESRHPVLILGETGTGKELVASAIHSYSSRKDYPFIALNCSALPENLVESELFGAEKGAFTDAVRRKGALAQAAKGTLFLDEVGSMSISIQPKLLRALEKGEYWKLGAEKPEKSDFKLVCATCENLEMQIEKGLFRSDLFYRISDLPISIPPLREHIEDVADLAEHFCLQSGKGYCDLSAQALAKLMNYKWPGNVRELKSVINRACANVQKGTIGAEDIVFMFCLKDVSKREQPF